MTVKVKNAFLGFLAVSLCFILSCFNVLAEYDSENGANLHQLPEYKSEDYVVNKYDINIVVNENNTFDIVEKRSVYFNKPKHGLLIEVPLKRDILLYGSSVKYKAQVSNIIVSDAHVKKYKANGNQCIKIGSSDETIVGKKDYTIWYKYNIGKDRLNDKDHLYYDLVSYGRDAPYGGITFSITMPKDFDASKLGFSAGIRGRKDSSKVKYRVDGNKITGRYIGVLQKNEALTVRCELPEGYFVGTGLDESFINYCLIGMSILFLIIVGLITITSLRGKLGPLIEPVEFYPPDDLNSLDVAYIYKEGNLEDKDATSLLVYLASKGYVKISEESDDDRFRITKIKEYDGNNESERIFLEGLFESGKNDVGYDDLYDKFYKTVNSVQRTADEANFTKIFKKFVLTKFNLILLMALVITIAVAGLNVYEAFDNYIYVVGGAIFLLMSVIVLGSKFNLKLRVIWFLIPWALSIFISYNEGTYFLANCVGIVCVAIMLVCAALLPKMTEYGHNMLGRVKGFRNFLVTAEKDRLEALVMDDPQYFYNILPYTYVLDISQKWIEQFESINLKEPDWYDGSKTFDVFVFDRMMSSTMSSMTQKQESSSNTSSWGSGDSGTGGGVAGGGYGGSSCSSW